MHGGNTAQQYLCRRQISQKNLEVVLDPITLRLSFFYGALRKGFGSGIFLDLLFPRCKVAGCLSVSRHVCVNVAASIFHALHRSVVVLGLSKAAPSSPLALNNLALNKISVTPYFLQPGLLLMTLKMRTPCIHSEHLCLFSFLIRKAPRYPTSKFITWSSRERGLTSPA